MAGFDPISGGLSLLGDIYSANSAADQAKRDREDQMNMFNTQTGLTRQQMANQSAIQNRQTNLSENANNRAENQAVLQRQAYQGIMGKSAEGESQFMNETGKAPTELETAKNDILTGNAKALNQGASEMQANLAQEGVRGGQAATQLRRGVGEMATGAQNNLNTMALTDAQEREKQRAAYLSAKGSAGNQTYGGL
jgi:hypothetical protein